MNNQPSASAISEERLAELSGCLNNIRLYQSISPPEVRAILTELSALRSAPSPACQGMPTEREYAIAACRTAWPNFDAFGVESKSKRISEMLNAFAMLPFDPKGADE